MRFRYWSHVVNCSSCNSAYKALNLTEVVLQIMSISMIGVIGLTKQATMTTVQRSTLFSMAILCFVASKWVSHFVYKTFRYHDYNHAFKWASQIPPGLPNMYILANIRLVNTESYKYSERALYLFVYLGLGISSCMIWFCGWGHSVMSAALALLSFFVWESICTLHCLSMID